MAARDRSAPERAGSRSGAGRRRRSRCAPTSACGTSIRTPTSRIASQQRHLKRLVCASIGSPAVCRRVAPGADELLAASIALFKTPGLRTLGHSGRRTSTPGAQDTLEDVVRSYVQASGLVRAGRAPERRAGAPAHGDRRGRRRSARRVPALAERGLRVGREAEQAVRVRGGGLRDANERLAADRGHRVGDHADVGGLVALSAVRDRGEVRRVGLDQEPVERARCGPRRAAPRRSGR